MIVDGERIYTTLLERSATPLATEDEGGGALWTRSGFVFVGAGAVEQAVLIDGGAGDCRLRLYDTADKECSEHTLREELRSSANSPVRFSIHRVAFRRGCYLRLEGTGPQAIIRTKGDL
ncbi:MAG: hypothetical protein ACREIR_16780 [Geminicoccaceae bacterium]